MEGRELLEFLSDLARTTGRTIEIPSQSRSYRLQGGTGDLSFTCWGSRVSRPLNGQIGRELPKVIALLDASKHLLVSKGKGWELVSKEELLTGMR